MTYRYPGGLVRRTAANTAITGASGVWDLGSQAQAVRNNTWPISGLANPISGSLRFRASNSAYLSRTPSVAGSQRIFTWSGWVKLGLLGTDRGIFGANQGTGYGTTQKVSTITLSAANTLRWVEYYSADGINNTWSYSLETTQLFRDPSAWYHIVAAIDYTQATASNRVKLYLNGSQITAFSTANYPTQNFDSWINTTSTQHQVGLYFTNFNSNPYYFDGYMAEVNFINGQQLTPASFGQTSAITGVWEPIKYTGTYGTNGYYLSLSDTSSIGKDFSGNGNNWTPNNFSTANDSTFDLMRDVPTQYTPQGVTDVGGVVRGNYCTWNPLNKSSNHNSTNGNLTASSSGGTSYGAICATMGVTSGKWYWEMTYTRNGSTNSPVIGFGNDLFTYTNPPFGYLGSDLNGGGINVFNGNAAINATSTAYGSAIATNDVVMFAMDLDNRKFYIGKNGTWFNSGNPVSGTNQWPYSATIVGSTFFPAVNMFNDTGDTNFGQRPFAYTPPSGFKSLCTTNLPTPTIGATTATAANKYFDATLITGTAATQVITNAGGFQPDFVWLKSRTNANNPTIYDAIRGVNTILYPALTNAEQVGTAQLTAFNSNGFTLGASENANDDNGEASVGWQWNAGGSTVTNTVGSISSQVRANPTAGFSIVTYTGIGGSGSIGHGLGVAPTMIIIKSRSSTTGWRVYQANLGITSYLVLNSTAAVATASMWGSPTSTAFIIGGTGYEVNESGATYVAYCFAPIAGYSSFGTYTGNGSADGPFVYTGFRPKFIIYKNATSATVGDWRIHDTSRSTFNAAQLEIYAQSADAEPASSNAQTDILSNGFKLRGVSGNTNWNQSGVTYIYAAFAETPFKNALAR